MRASKQVVICPVCFSKNVRCLYAVTSEQAAQGFVLCEGNSERHHSLRLQIETLWGMDKCSVQQCLACDFAFAHPFVAGDMRFYNLAFERSSYPIDKWEYRRTLLELNRMKFRAKRVMEVGAGTGLFLDKLVGTHAEKTGITALEFSDNSVRALRGKGYAVIQSDFLDANLEPCFDAIFVFQVLEHMDNLDDRFDRLSSLLSDGGVLFIAVPNPKWINFNEQNGSLLDMPPNHIGRWSEGALRVIGSRHGLVLEKHEVAPFSLKEFIKTDIAFSFLRHAQEPGTIANRLRSLRSSKYGRFLGVAAAASMAPSRLAVWRRALKEPDLGISVWAKFTRRGRTRKSGGES